MSNTSKSSGQNYRAAEQAALSAGSAFKSWVKGEESVTVQCVDAVALALRTGLIHTGEGTAPEGTYSRAAYGAKYFGLTNGSLVTFWSTLSVAVAKGVKVDSDLFRVLAYGPKVGRKGGVAEAIAKSPKSATGVAKAITAAGFDPKTGEKNGKGTPRNVGGQAGGTPSDAMTAAAEAVKALKAALGKIPAGNSTEWLQIRKAVTDLLISQDKGRKSGKFAPKVPAAKGPETVTAPAAVA